ncbi:hypothetical protein Bhyg_13856 [Pseudolycoriella hygida]|uniref:Uncharacterized protein n=1 Tax=Pseudolycoriella hygida TaxID=35572 RepID=A0A9Q0MNZ5_9DIPT|nr:hypothetical protein Bhyg_13856 [Pseudolycoriella hygida]
MEAVWRFRIMLGMAFAIIIFGDFLGYGSIRAEKHINRQAPTALREKQPEIHLEDGTSISDLSHSSTKSNEAANHQVINLSANMRNSCLPKMLCEIAAKPRTSLNDKEKTLLDLLTKTTLSTSWYASPSKWHYASHMGQLMRYTGDAMNGPMGCSQLWPQCPFSSKRLLQLSAKVVMK